MLGYAKTRFIKMAFQRTNDSKLQSRQQIVDLEGNLHAANEADRVTTQHDRTKAALGAIENKRHDRQVTSKDCPIAASSSEAWEADQRQLEEEQLAAYSEDPLPSVEVKNAPIAAEDEENDLFKGVKFSSHDCTAENEVIIGGPFTDGIPQIMLALWNGDIEDSKKLSYEARHRLKFFGKTIQETALMPLAKRVATLILGGDEEEVEEAIAIVKKYPEILRCPPVFARDRTDSPDFRLMTRETDAELKNGEKHLYIGRADDGGLDYKILDAQGNPIVGHITTKELGQEIKADPAFTLPNLNKLRGVILNITSKRGHTPKGRAVKAKILQIAAMAGDFDLPGMEEKIKQAEEKERTANTPEEKSKATIEKETLKKRGGIVEQLAAIENGLSQEEVKEQLEEVITGEKAKQQNQQRVDRITEAVKRFGEGILIKKQEYKGNLEDYNNFPEFQKLCQPLIDQLRKELQHDPKEITTSGFIFDESILYKAADWFEYGYELCPMPNQPDNEIKLEKGKLYWEKTDNSYAYSVVTPDGKEVRHKRFEIDPMHFKLGNLHESRLKEIIKETVFKAASEAKDIVTNLNRFSGWWSIVSDVFWDNGFGQLQPKLSARGKDVAHHGIGLVVDSKEIPARGSCAGQGISYINSSSGCGVTHFLGYYGVLVRAGGPHVHGALENLCRAKTTALQSLYNARRHQHRASA